MRGTIGTAATLLALGLVLTTRTPTRATAWHTKVALDVMHAEGLCVTDGTVAATQTMIAVHGTAAWFALWLWPSARTESFAAALFAVVRPGAAVAARHDEVR